MEEVPGNYVSGGRKVSWQRIPTPATPMLLLTGNYANGQLKLDGETQDPSGADIRLRFQFDLDQREAAKSAADYIAKKLTEFGAVNVTLDPVPVPTTRARIPELATTVRLEDKLRLYWKAIGFEPDEKRAAELMGGVGLLQDEAAALGLSLGTAGRAAPTLKKVHLRGFKKFPNEVEIDFRELEGSITAIIAPNEMGKTVLMQLIGQGLLYGDTPSRGSLDDLSRAKDAFVEGEFTMGGDDYKLTQVADGQNRKGTVSLLKNSVTVLGNKSAGGRKDYADWGLKNLLPRNVYDAIICQSGTTPIIDMKDGPRVELLLRVLGLEIYETLAKMARDRASNVSDQLGEVRARIDEIGDVEIWPLKNMVTLRQFSVDEGVVAVNEAVAALSAAQKMATAIEKQRAEYDALVKRRSDIQTRLFDLSRHLAELQTKIDVNKHLTAEKEQIENAVAEIARLTAEVDALPIHSLELRRTKGVAETDRLKSEMAAFARRIEEGQAEEEELKARQTALETRIDEGKKLVAGAAEIRAAVKVTTDLQSAIDEDLEPRNEMVLLANTLEGEINGLTQRAGEQQRRAARLEQIISDAKSLVEYKPIALAEKEATAQYEADLARVVRDYDAVQIEIEQLQQRTVGDKDTRITGLRTGLETIRDTAEPIMAPGIARSTLVADDKAENYIDLTDQILNLRSKAADLLSERRDIQETIDSCRKEAARLPEIERAEKELQDAKAELATIPSSTVQDEIEGKQKECQALYRRIEEMRSEQVRRTARIAELEPLASKVGELQAADSLIAVLEERHRQLVNDRAANTRAAETMDRELAEIGVIAVETLGKMQHWKSEIDICTAAITERTVRIQKLKPLAVKAGLLAEAEVRLQELEAQRGRAIDDRATLQNNLAEFPVLPELPDAVDLAPYEAAVTSARQSVADVQTQLALAQKELENAETKERRKQELTAQVRGLDEQVANWTLLGQHLGKDGLQREELSCAGPTLTATTNDFLRRAGDTRHTVSIETEKLHSDKKRMIPTLDINVFDSEEGETKESRRLSDAGKVLVGWPFNLSMIKLGCARAGVSSPTILIDEALGPADTINAPRCIAMLRHFAEELDSHVLFIAQQPSAWELADSRITLNNGKVTVS